MDARNKHFTYLLSPLAMGTFIVVAIFSCGGSGESTNPPPERSATNITGTVGFMSGANIRAYSVNTMGMPDSALGQSVVSNDQWQYQLPLRTTDQIILLTASGGNYFEQASHQSVALRENEHLLTFVNYHNTASTMVVSISPLTHLIAGCTRHTVQQVRMDLLAALMHCEQIIETLYSINPLQSPLVNIHRSTATPAQIYHRLLLAGLSQLTAQISQDNNVLPHSIYSSLRLTQLMYNDFVADGQLNGQGEGGDILRMGHYTFNANSYRNDWARAVIKIATQLYPADILEEIMLLERMNQVANSIHLIYGARANELLDEQPPNIILLHADGVHISRQTSYTVRVEDLTAVTHTEFFLNDHFLGRTTQAPTATITFDTSAFTDGHYTLHTRAIDRFGNIATTSATIRIVNNGPLIHLATHAPIVNDPTLSIQGNIESVADIQSLSVDGVPITLDDSSFTFTSTLQEGKNILTLSAVDVLGNASTRQAVVHLDTQPPQVSITYSTAEYIANNVISEASLENAENIAGAHNRLYVTTSRISLVPQISARDETYMRQNKIPYYKISLIEENQVRTTTPILRIRYWGGHQTPLWRQIYPTHHSSTTYIIPLIAPVLAENWHHAPDNHTHRIEFQVTDAAQNRTEISKQFRVHFALNRLTIQSQIINGFAQVYAYDTTQHIQRHRIDTCVTDNQGLCHIRLFIPPQALVVIVSGGTIQEMASDVIINLEENQSFYTYINYAGGNAHISNSVITTIARALIESTKINDLAEIETRLIALFDINPNSTPFVYVDDIAHNSPQLSDALKYGYWLMGISQYTAHINTINQHAPHSRFNSYDFAATLNDDITADGRADGLLTSQSIRIGQTVINGDSYRFYIARHVMDYRNSPQHKLHFSANELLPFVNHLAGADDDIFIGHPITLVDIDAPIIHIQPITATWISGGIVFHIQVRDQYPTYLQIEIDNRMVSSTISTSVHFVVNSHNYLDGTHSLRISATDRQGNLSTSIRQFNSDNHPPNVSMQLTTATWVSGAVSAHFAVTDIAPTSLHITLNGNAIYSGTSTAHHLTIPTHTLADGTHRITMYAQDALGQATSLTRTFASDNHPPQLLFIPPQIVNGVLANTVTFSISIADVSANRENISIQLNDSMVNTSSPSYGIQVHAQGDTLTLTFRTTVFTAPTLTITIMASDALGHTSRVQRSFPLDYTPPVMELNIISDHPHPRYSSTSFRVGYQVVDRTFDHITAILIQHNPSQTYSIFSSRNSTGMVHIASRAYSDGNYQLFFTAYDKVGLVSTASINFYIDQNPPMISISTPQRRVTGRVALSLDITDTIFAPTTTTIIWGSTILHTHSTASSTRISVEVPTAQFADGQITLTAQASDLAGNTAQYPFNLLVDNHSPRVTLHSDTSRWHHRQSSFSWSVYDGPYTDWTYQFVLQQGAYRGTQTSNGLRIPLHSVGLSGGTYSWTLTIRDSFNHTTTLNGALKWSPIAPSITTSISERGTIRCVISAQYTIGVSGFKRLNISPNPITFRHFNQTVSIIVYKNNAHTLTIEDHAGRTASANVVCH